MKLSKIRGDDGKLPAYAWPGGYQIIYVMTDGEVICPDCANGENGSLARPKGMPGEDDRDGWAIEGADIFYEGPAENCAHCGAVIESAYGDPAEA